MANNRDNEIIMLQRELAYEKYLNEHTTANLDYVAMMTDVDIPTEEEDENE